MDTQDLRPLSTRLIERWLHGPKRERCRDHCECVTDLRSHMKIAKWLIGLLVVGFVQSMARQGCDLAALRVQVNPPPPRSGERMPGIDPVK